MTFSQSSRYNKLSNETENKMSAEHKAASGVAKRISQASLY